MVLVYLSKIVLILQRVPSITKNGINAGNKTISNVATAVNGTEAVNKAQLDAAIAAIPTTGGATTLKTAADNSTTGTVALATQSLAVNGTANYVTTLQMVMPLPLI